MDELIERLRNHITVEIVYDGSGCWHTEEIPEPICLEAADALDAKDARIKQLEALLIKEREHQLWEAYCTGFELSDYENLPDQWDHQCMSSGEWLASECGFDPGQRIYNAEEIKAAIPTAARGVLKGSSDGQ